MNTYMFGVFGLPRPTVLMQYPLYKQTSSIAFDGSDRSIHTRSNFISFTNWELLTASK